MAFTHVLFVLNLINTYSYHSFLRLWHFKCVAKCGGREEEQDIRRKDGSSPPLPFRWFAFHLASKFHHRSAADDAKCSAEERETESIELQKNGFPVCPILPWLRYFVCASETGSRNERENSFTG